MKKIIFFIAVVVIGLYITNSKNDIQSSQSYIKQNRAAITSLLETYLKHNRTQDFSFGFLDNEYKTYMVQVYTDSVRYIYKSDVSILQNFKELNHTAADRAKIDEVAQKIRQAKAIWIQSRNVYLSGFEQKAIEVSFKPQMINTPFTPTKFVTLLVMHNFENIALDEDELEKFNLYKIEPGIYQTISNQFR